MRPMPPDPDGRRVAIGSRLRAARKAQRLTIEEVARVTGLTKGFLSRVERDITSPSVSSLTAICDVLSISIGALFEKPAVQFLPAGTGPHLNLGGVASEELLLSPRNEPRLQVIRTSIAPGGHGGEQLYTVTADFDLLHVFAGSITVRFTSGEWELGPGDSLSFSGREPHSWIAGTEGAEAVWVLAPALWNV